MAFTSSPSPSGHAASRNAAAVVQPPAPRPDLVISAMDYDPVHGYFFTVTNQGAGAAGPFTVDVSVFKAFSFGGLAAGASITQGYTFTCLATPRVATADALAQVAETDEANNTRSLTPICIV